MLFVHDDIHHLIDVVLGLAVVDGLHDISHVHHVVTIDIALEDEIYRSSDIPGGHRHGIVVPAECTCHALADVDTAEYVALGRSACVGEFNRRARSIVVLALPYE